MEGNSALGQKVTRAGEQKLMQHYGGAVWLTHMKHLSVPFYQAYDNETMETARCADLLLGKSWTKSFFFLRFKSHPFTFSLPANFPIVEVLNKI